MDTKYVIAIVVLMFMNISNQQGNKKERLSDSLSIELSINADTCYYSEDKIVISMEIENVGFSSIQINQNMPVTTKDMPKSDAIIINILHDGKLYEYAYLDGKEAMPKRKKLRKNKTLKIVDILNFRLLVPKSKIITNFSTTKIDNRDFGVYQLQSFYVRNTYDTISSNSVTINYLK